MGIRRKKKYCMYGMLVLQVLLVYVYRDNLFTRVSMEEDTQLLNTELISSSQKKNGRNGDRLFIDDKQSGPLKVTANKPTHGDIPVNECPDLKLASQDFRMEEGKWHSIDEAKHGYVFSAYHNEIKNNSVQLIGVRETRWRRTVFCLFWFTNFVHQTTGMVENLHSSSGWRYTSSLFTCNIPNGRVPIAVSLTTANCSSPLNVLPVKKVRKRPYEKSFTVCLSPLNFRYGRAYELVEWLELNIILGAEKFVIYNYSSASNVAEVLNDYSKRGLAEVVQWQLPMGVNKWPVTKDPVEIHYFAQMAALNDCLFRSKETSEFIVNIDVDEFIIPHKNNIRSWKDMLSGLDHKGAYLFQHTPFRKEWDDIDNNFTRKEQANTYRLITLLKTLHEDIIHPHKVKSKYIVRSNSVEILVTHDIDKMVSGQSIAHVSYDHGLVHHYRNYEQYNDNQKRVKDTTVIDKYTDILIDNVAKKWSQLKQVKMDIPI